MSLLNFTNGIRQRILLSSFVVLILFVLSSVFSLQQFSSSTDSFRQLEAVGIESTLMMELRADLGELRLDILHYNESGLESAFTRVERSLSKLEEGLEVVGSSVSDLERVAVLSKIEELFANYAANINSMKESRELEQEVRERQIPAFSRRVLSRIQLSVENAELDGNAELLDRLQVAQNHLLQAEVRMIAYQIYKRNESQQRALDYMRRAGQQVHGAMTEVAMSRENEEALALLSEDIQSYSMLFRQAVQALRGSVFLMSVVMAGETEEFAFLVSQLSESTRERQRTLGLAVNNELNDARLTTSTVMLGAILLSLLLSLSLSQSILRPIQEISLVFQRLAKGDVNGPIPGLERRDEIGMLAASATVFKNVSMRTKQLLDESENLTTALQQREKELEAKTVELGRSLDDLNNFTYVASHDLKSPLRAIDNLARWVVEDCGDNLPAESVGHLELMQQRITLMEGLLDDLLVYSKVGKVKEQLSEVSFLAVLDEVMMLCDIPEGFEIRLPESDIQFETLSVSLRQVLLNLFTNAFKYGGSEQSLLIVEWQESAEGVLTFSVADDGVGIEPRYHSRIFEMFETLNTRDTYLSSGMGLAIVRKVLESVGGTITVESELGAGAKFIFTWPKDCSDYIHVREKDVA